MKLWYTSAHSKCSAWFHLPRGGLKMAARPRKLLQDSRRLTVFCWLEYCIVYLANSAGKLSSINWSFDGVVVTPDTTDPVSVKHFRVTCTAPLETLSPAGLWKGGKEGLCTLPNSIIVCLVWTMHCYFIQFLILFGRGSSLLRKPTHNSSVQSAIKSDLPLWH